MTTQPARILLAGHVCLDFVLEPGTRLPPAGSLLACGPMQIQVGGLVANTSRALGTLGLACAIDAAVGDDLVGETTATLLHRIPGTAPDLTTIAGTSSSFSVIVDGADRSVLHHAGANDAYRGPRTIGETIELVHIGYPPLLGGLCAGGGEQMATVLSTIRSTGRTTSMDFAVPGDSATAQWAHRWRRWAPLVDIVSPSLDDLDAMGLSPASSGTRLERAQASARALVADGVAIAMVTAGRDGMALCTAPEERLNRAGAAISLLTGWWQQNLIMTAESTDANRTLGAGDVASAGLLAGILSRESARDSMALARSLAAEHVRGAGAPSQTAAAQRARFG